MHIVSSLFPLAQYHWTTCSVIVRHRVWTPSTCIGLPKTICHPQGCLMRLLGSRRRRITTSCSCQATQIAHTQIAHVATQNTEKGCAENVSNA